MRMKTAGLLLAGALIAAPALQAQTPEAQPMRGHAGPGLAAMLRSHAELGLTAEQVARLEAIEAELRARNAPMREQLQALRPEGMRERHRERHERGARPQVTEEQRREMRARMEQARPLMEQMRANMQAAMERARAVLTEEQRARLETRMREHRREHRREGGHGMPGRHGGERPPRSR